MVLTKHKLRYGHKSEMPEGLSFFTQSSRPYSWRDWVKEKQLGAPRPPRLSESDGGQVCDSVVKLDHLNQPSQPIQQGNEQWEK